MNIQRVKYEDIRFPRFGVAPRNNPPLKKNVIGFDTETDKGKCSLISSSEGIHKICVARTDAFRFILDSRRYRGTLNFFWNLTYDTNAIIKWLDIEELGRLARYNRIKTLDGFHIDMIPGKRLTIGRWYETKRGLTVKDSVTFYDAANFYNKKSLVNAYQITFKEEYKKLVNAAEKINFPADEITDIDIQYCIEDSKVCQRLADHLVQATNRLMACDRYNSPASLAKAYLRQNLKEEYKPSKTPAGKYSFNAFAGGRFECLKRGTWDFDNMGNREKEGLYMHDVNSCYPFMMSKLPEIDPMRWEQSVVFEPDIFYGFYRCSVLIHECHISPVVIWHPEYNVRVYPTGIIKEIYLTSPEIQCLLDSGHEISIKEGWINPGTNNKAFPFMEDLYKSRKELKDDPLERVIKLISNSMYGCTVEKKVKPILYQADEGSAIRCRGTNDTKRCEWYSQDPGSFAECPVCGGFLETCAWGKEYKMGPFFNPAYGAYITAMSRIKLYQDSLRKIDKVVMYATDSITFEGRAKYLSIGEELGQYDSYGPCEGVVIGSGVYSFNHGEKFALRGFERLDVGKLIDKAPLNAEKLSHSKNRPVKLKTAVRSGIEELNVFHNVTKELDLSFDRKRIWDPKKLTVRSLLRDRYESNPIILNN